MIVKIENLKHSVIKSLRHYEIKILNILLDAGVIIRKIQHFVIKCCIFLYTYIIDILRNYLTHEIKFFK